MKRKILATILAVSSIFSTVSTLPASASWNALVRINMSNLNDLNMKTDDEFNQIIAIVDNLIESSNELSRSLKNRYNTNPPYTMNQIKGDKDITNFKDKNKKLMEQLRSKSKNIAKLVADMCSAASNSPTIVRKPDKNGKFQTMVYDFSETYLFIRQILNEYKDKLKNIAQLTCTDTEKDALKKSLPEQFNLSDYCNIKMKTYNDIMDKHFGNAIADSNIKQNGDKITGLNLQLNTFNQNQVTKTNISELTIPVEQVRHIIVGSPLPQPQLAFGHTKYAENGLQEIINGRKNHVISYPVLGLEKYFEYCTGIKTDEYSDNVINPLGGGAVERKYLAFNTHTYQKKGLFPDNWGWEKIKTAITSILKDYPKSLKYEHTKYVNIKQPGQQNMTKQLKGQYSFFFGKYEDVPITIVVNANDKTVITAFPTSEQEFINKKAENINGAENVQVYN